ncbi:hypothetical protein DM01DRAFT_1390989 [Hesseltinella vesiculosa]|uniref:Uncharacterized protein n=1 Tax=Hesseltinella vesiculosa TaxID=101127 RepID=A0A1X2GGB8_9FUNG|nr:hypothetical protein DM01DRAFT_1390989 [Hesseltinella vesiculosa]
MTPIPHGLTKQFSITEEDCRTFKIPLLFNTLCAYEWADIDKVVDELWKVASLRVKDAKSANGALVSSINNVALNQKNWFQLVSYCRQLIAHYKLKEPSVAFEAAWVLKMQKQKALDMGAMNGVKLSQLGAKQFGKEVDNLLDDADKENCYPSESTGATTTAEQ